MASSSEVERAAGATAVMPAVPSSVRVPKLEVDEVKAVRDGVGIEDGVEAKGVWVEGLRWHRRRR